MEYIIDNSCLICSTKITCDKYIISGKIGIQYICLPENVLKIIYVAEKLTRDMGILVLIFLDQYTNYSF